MSTIVNIFILLKKSVDKVLKEIVKTMSHQTKHQWRDKSYKKETNTNSWIKEYNNKNVKFTRRVQQNSWENIRKYQLTWRKIKWD